MPNRKLSPCFSQCLPFYKCLILNQINMALEFDTVGRSRVLYQGNGVELGNSFQPPNPFACWLIYIRSSMSDTVTGAPATGGAKKVSRVSEAVIRIAGNSQDGIQAIGGFLARLAGRSEQEVMTFMTIPSRSEEHTS